MVKDHVAKYFGILGFILLPFIVGYWDKWEILLEPIY